MEAYRADPEAVFEGPVEVVTPLPRVYWRTTSPVHGSDGALLGRLWTFHDITERLELLVIFGPAEGLRG